MSDLLASVSTIFDPKASEHGRRVAVDDFRVLRTLPDNSEAILDAILEGYQQIHTNPVKQVVLYHQMVAAADQAFHHLAIQGAQLVRDNAWVNPAFHLFFSEITYGRMFIVGSALKKRHEQGMETFPNGGNLYHFMMRYGVPGRAVVFFNDAVTQLQPKYKTLSTLAAQWLVQRDNDDNTPLSIAFTHHKYHGMSSHTMRHFLGLIQYCLDTQIDLTTPDRNGVTVMDQLHSWVNANKEQMAEFSPLNKSVQQCVKSRYENLMLSRLTDAHHQERAARKM